MVNAFYKVEFKSSIIQALYTLYTYTYPLERDLEREGEKNKVYVELLNY